MLVTAVEVVEETNDFARLIPMLEQAKETTLADAAPIPLAPDTHVPSLHREGEPRTPIRVYVEPVGPACFVIGTKIDPHES